MGVRLIVGIPGTGKNTYMTTLAIKHMKSGLPVFSNYPIKATAFFRYEFTCNIFDMNNLNENYFPPGAMIIVDEAHLRFNSRDSLDKKTSNMGQGMREFLTYVRHMDNDIYILCQMQGAVDKYLREYAEKIVMLRFMKPRWLFARLRRVLTFWSAKDFDSPDWEDLRRKGMINVSFMLLNKKVWKKYDSVYGRDIIKAMRDLIDSTRYPMFKDIHINTFPEKIFHNLRNRLLLYKKLKLEKKIDQANLKSMQEIYEVEQPLHIKAVEAWEDAQK